MDPITIQEMHNHHIEVYNKLTSFCAPMGYPNIPQFDNLVQELAKSQTILKHIQNMLCHEFTSIDSKFDPLILCNDFDKWRDVILILQQKISGASTVAKRNR
jgi:hypothetical protein